MVAIDGGFLAVGVLERVGCEDMIEAAKAEQRVGEGGDDIEFVGDHDPGAVLVMEKEDEAVEGRFDGDVDAAGKRSELEVEGGGGVEVVKIIGDFFAWAGGVGELEEL